MVQQYQSDLPARIYSEVVVRSASGDSLLNSSHRVTSENIHRFYASADRLQAAAQRLLSKGFEVLDIGKMSITIAAAPEVYARSLQTTLEAVERPAIKELGQTTTATFINALDARPFGEIDVSLTAWSELIDGVAINEPFYYFQSELPSSTPPATSKAYLSAPEGVAQGLNATLAHQQGITGKGVKVAMVDSGWYPHPFFEERNYKVDVRLAPGSSNPTRDDSGHGTGESANVFAIAPDVALTMVKADVALAGKVKNVNSISAFRTAVALKPDIITCSWGSDQRGRSLSLYNRLLEVMVVDAVRQGITVVFAAGNGQYGFPAQHPQVIAAGGVFRHLTGSLRGTLEASNYASSFISPIYSGRQVPDVCGLVGQLPHGSYLMLPVPPGSLADKRLAIGKDGTEPTDGWAAFSGTSAAAPQLAGVCALMKQVNPNLSPAAAKRILQETAHDVTSGFSNPSSSGASARAGPDLSTGYGLANAYAVLQAIPLKVSQGESRLQFPSFSSSNSPSLKEPQNFNSLQTYSIPIGETIMNVDYPKLKENLDEILWEFEKILKNKGINEIELSVTESNFVSRSLKSKTAFSLRKILDDCSTSDNAPITKKHLLAAQGLLKLNKYTETAIKVITDILNESEDSSLQKLAVKALGEYRHEFEIEPPNSHLLDCRDCFPGECPPGYCKVCNGNLVRC